MAHIRPFSAIRYARRNDLDLSSLIAPPYDVLDEKGKAALQAQHPNNIVTVDLPHLPPKTVGPDSTYHQAAATFQSWLAGRILAHDPRPAIYPYMQSYQHNGHTFHRRGFFALVKLSPFGAGEVIPHEKTYDAPIEDRLKLMRATGVQLSPIFGLFSDPRNQVTNLLYEHAGKPESSATLDGVRNDLWSVPGAEVETKVIDAMASKPVYIADGHHRYTTALQYQKEMAAQAGGKLPEAHPANWCLFVLVAMQDPGLQILPTHRLIGGVAHFSGTILKSVLGDHFDVKELSIGPEAIPDYLRHTLPRQAPHTFALYDGATRKLYELHLRDVDVLKPLEPSHSDAWRRLDVAILQRYLLDEVIGPKFAAGKELIKGYTANPDEVVPQVDGHKYQLALLIQPTPLHALEDLGKHGEVMPQKSTFFYPKLATGMVINPIR